jgi:hypothetical protein
MVGSTTEQAVFEHDGGIAEEPFALWALRSFGTALTSSILRHQDFRDTRLAIARALSAARLRTPSFRYIL